MKKKYLLMLLFSCISFTQAQIVNIPDVNFKAALIANGVDTNSDGEIQESEALAVTIIDFPNRNILSMDGLEYFINLKNIYCESNQLTSLDVSQNLNLELENSFASKEYTQEAILDISKKIKQLGDTIDEKEMRWFELSAKLEDN